MVYKFKAQDTITPVEVNCGDSILYTLSSGFTNRLEVVDCVCRVVETNKQDLTSDFPPGGTLLKLVCKVKINGFAAVLVKYIGSQESFYQPYVINGMQLWLDNAKCLFEVIPENHGACGVHRDVRLVLHDNALPICPQQLTDWCELYGKTVLDIGECYNGDDCYLGAYNGSSAHGGLDINQPKGTPIYAPLDFDDQCFFQSLASGDPNNRWKMIRHWDENRAWVFQVHHIGGITVQEHTPVAQGTKVADGALVYLGEHPHSHFVFRAYENGEEFVLDPWIVFRQILWNKQKWHCAIRHHSQIITGEKACLSACCDKQGASYLWRISDGSSYCGESVCHIFIDPGIYAIELLATADGEQSYSMEYVTVLGNAISTPRMAVLASERGFLERQLPYTPNYGVPPEFLNTFDVAFHRGYKGKLRREFTVAKTGKLAADPQKLCLQADSDAVQLEVAKRDENSLAVFVTLDAGKLEDGQLIRIEVHSELLNGSQTIWLKVRTVDAQESGDVICSCKSRDFYCSGYDFVGHKFTHWYGSRGCDNFYLTDAGEKNPGTKAVFQPVLTAGRYRVALMDHDLLKQGCLLAAKVTDAKGEHSITVDPRKTLEIGTFDFWEGNGGRVELLSAQSTGVVLADALRFTREGSSEKA